MCAVLIYWQLINILNNFSFSHFYAWELLMNNCQVSWLNGQHFSSFIVRTHHTVNTDLTLEKSRKMQPEKEGVTSDKGCS